MASATAVQALIRALRPTFRKEGINTSRLHRVWNGLRPLHKSTAQCPNPARCQLPSMLGGVVVAFSPQSGTRAFNCSRMQGPMGNRSLEDKVVFAVHAVLAANGLRLVAVGPAAECPVASAAASSKEEASLEGWNTTGTEDLGGSYSFLYALDPPAGSPAGSRTTLLLVKCLPVEGTVLVNLLADPTAASSQPIHQAGAGAVQPTTFELQASQFSPSPDNLSPSECQNLDQLVDKVQKGLAEQVSAPAARTTAASQHPKTEQQQQQQQQQTISPQQPLRGDFDPLRDYSQPSRIPAFDPASVGRGDILPGGLPDLRPGGFGGPGGGYGGMLVGPSNFPGRGRQPPGTFPIPPTHPAGARWDPIAPEGMQGWNPDDFTREGRMRQNQRQGVPDPDIMQPGPGRGPDFDAMFG